MKNIVLINPLNADKLEDYKAFMASLTSEYKAGYTDMLNRYGLKNSQVYYHQLQGVEFVVVIHDVEDYVFERLKTWATSTNEFDIWFKEQTKDFYNAEVAKQAGQPELLLAFNPS